MVFDIDWTITSEVDPNYQGNRIIEVEGKKYFVHDGLEELITNLISKKGFKISFFSGGPKGRNTALLSKIKLSDGRSLLDIAYKVLGKEDLSDNPTAQPTDKFAVRYKKDLTKIHPNLDQVIMLDDTLHFVPADQEGHVIYTGKTFSHFATFEDSIGLAGEYVPQTLSEWSFARKKLFLYNTGIEHALSESKRLGITFPEAMQREVDLLDFKSGIWNDYTRGLMKGGMPKAIKANCIDQVRALILAN